MSQVKITRIGVFSLAKLQAVICAVVGLILGVIYGVIYGVMMLFVGGMAIFGSRTGESGAALGGLGLGLVGGIVMIVVMVVLYTIIGFIAGAISALVYNGAAKLLGGLEIDIQTDVPQYSAPPAPQAWNPAGYSTPA